MKFSIRDVVWLTVVVGIALGWWSWSLTIPPADEQVAGTIVVAGTPLATGRVYFHSANGQFVGAQVTNGQYSLKNIPIGVYDITVEGKGVPPKYSGKSSGLIVEVKDGANHIDLDLL